MKKNFSILILILMFSCKSYKSFTDQQVVLKQNGTQKMNIKNNQYTSTFKINGKEADFLVDTGAMTSVITDSLFLKNFKLTNENFYSSFKAKGAGGIEVESEKFISDSVTSSLLQANKKIFNFLKVSNYQNKKCSNGSEIKKTVGIIGYDFFRIASKPVLLNFQNNTIEALNSDFSTNGYVKLKSKISAFKPKIELTFNIDGKDIDFLFDTGNSGSFILKDKDNTLNNSKLVQEFEQIIGAVDGINIMDSKYYKDVTIKLEGNFETKANVLVMTNVITNTLGINYIKNFNWILDFENGEIYVKKISDLSSVATLPMLKKDYIFGNNNLKLIIGYKNMTNNDLKYNTGDEITSVNGTAVTEENICEMQDLLNNTQDLEKLKLEVTPFNKK